MSRLTRSKTALKNPELGQPSELPESVLPSWGDVYRYVRFCQVEWRSIHGGGNQNPPNVTILNQVQSKLSAIWEKFTFPTCPPRMIKYSIESLQGKAATLFKVPQAKRDERWNDEVASWNDVMFDISGCRCFDASIQIFGDVSKMKQRRLEDPESFAVTMYDIRKSCACKTKLPYDEWPAYCDQKLRIGMLGPVDAQATARLQVRLQKEKERERREEAERERRATDQFVTEDVPLDDCLDVGVDAGVEEIEDDDPNDVADPEFLVARDSQYVPKNSRNRHDITNLAIECDRFSISDVAGAAIANAILKDYGLLDGSNTLDPLKLRRWRESTRSKAVSEQFSVHQGLHALAFDGKRVNGLTVEEVVIKTKKGETIEKKRGRKAQEYIVVLTEPEHLYLDHFVPKSGNAADITLELFGLVASRNSKDSLKCLCADGAAVNTGKHGGVIRRMELLLDRPVQWNVCGLHMNELHLREILTKVDGRTSGPRTLEGPIGKAITGDLRSLPIVPFTAVPGKVGEIPEEVVKDLSSEQKYFFEIARSVQAGRMLSPGLAQRKPGVLDNARWLTKANRIMRLYVATASPSTELKRLVFNILNLYAPAWFKIKTHWKIKDGSRNFFYMVTLLRALPEEDRRIQKPVILRNSYFAHPENVLLSGITSEVERERRFAVQMILEARANDRQRTEVRVFQPPQDVNFDARHYLDLVPSDVWRKKEYSSPPLLRDFSDDEIQSAVSQPLKILEIPAHTQAVERGVKLMAEAAEKYYGHDRRHGFILTTLEGRAKMPTFKSKREYPV